MAFCKEITGELCPSNITLFSFFPAANNEKKQTFAFSSFKVYFSLIQRFLLISKNVASINGIKKSERTRVQKQNGNVL